MKKPVIQLKKCYQSRLCGIQHEKRYTTRKMSHSSQKCVFNAKIVIQHGVRFMFVWEAQKYEIILKHTSAVSYSIVYKTRQQNWRKLGTILYETQQHIVLRRGAGGTSSLKLNWYSDPPRKLCSRAKPS